MNNETVIRVRGTAQSWNPRVLAVGDGPDTVDLVVGDVLQTRRFLEELVHQLAEELRTVRAREQVATG